jgi:TfoX/Sxy family transcriptional regulator of competence genes
MKIPKPDESTTELFNSIVPEDPHVTIRPMFGNLSGFVNGNMFMGVYGNDLFVRLSEADQKELLKNSGASMFSPMKGRPMKEYVILPRAWADQPEKLRLWVTRSLEWAGKMPKKQKKPKR